jgi:hypothetical protein
VLQAHADEAAIRNVALAADNRCRILVNVINEYVGVFRITSHLVNLVLRFTERPQFKSLFSGRVRVGRTFYLLQAFFQKDVISFDEDRAACLVLGDDFLDGKNGVTDVGVRSAGQCIVRVKIERSVVINEFNSFEVATNGNDLVIDVGATKRAALDSRVNDDRVIDEFLINLLRPDREIRLAAFLVLIDVEESFEVLAFLEDAVVAYSSFFRAGGV